MSAPPRHPPSLAPEGTYYASPTDPTTVRYFTDGLMRQPAGIIEAVVAHEVAHEVMGHVGARRKLSLSLTASSGALGIFASPRASGCSTS